MAAGGLQIVTASDSRFFPHLQNLLLTIDRQQERNFRLAVIDVGLEEQQRAELSQHGLAIVKGAVGVFGDDLTIAPYLDLRPCLPELFPQADRLLWLDADVWLQRPDWLQAIVGLLDEYAFIVSPQLHVAYGANSLDAKLQAAAGDLVRPVGFNYDLLRRMFGNAHAALMSKRPTLNGGMFGGRRDSGIWARWKRIYRDCVNWRSEFGIDQVTLMCAVAADDSDVGFIPPELNWMCHFSPPAYDYRRKRFVMPTPMYHELYALHLTAFTKTKPCRVSGRGGDALVVELFEPAIVRAAASGLPLPPPRASLEQPEVLESWPRIAVAPAASREDTALQSSALIARPRRSGLLKKLSKKLLKPLRRRFSTP